MDQQNLNNAPQESEAISVMRIMENQAQLQMKMMELLANMSSSRNDTDHVVTAQLSLAQFDPDDTTFSTKEWIEEVDRIKLETGMSDTVVVLKAGQALKRHAAKFYQNWKPILRNWSTFSRDLEIAFPQKGTPATRLKESMLISSANFSSLVEYAHVKLNSIRKFYNKFPWEIVLSLVTHDITNTEVKNRVVLQEPEDEMELLKLLSSFDSDAPLVSDNSRKRSNQMKVETESRFNGQYRKCGYSGHKADDCRSTKRRAQNPPYERQVLLCNFCKRKGHLEKFCFAKRENANSLNKTLIAKSSSKICQYPEGELKHNDNFVQISYLIDTGSDISLVKESIAKKLNCDIVLKQKFISGIGNVLCKTIGTTYILFYKRGLAIEIEFNVVSDHIIPHTNIDALIGMDILREKDIQLKVDKNCVYFETTFRPFKVLSIDSKAESRIDLSGLDEQLKIKIMKIINESVQSKPEAVTTGRLKIQLKEDNPIAFRARNFSYQERPKVKEIIKKQLESGIIRPSESNYASPIVLVRKRNGEIRLCVDYRELNKKVLRINYPLPRIQNQIDLLANAKYYSKLDMKSGFHQMEIEESSKHITAFITPDGLYE
ncbi:uncharacterized protein LOC123320999 [Coccinella septempunctata]|uniref:uncharacterized protein LOC123320999 n=1 Tax=Coccinella septempunctata TaxID=41139 RepID=UPI001D077B4A|nr:uncharacterized protein LOC123320999 [Coccinella septempunctata]